MRRWVCGGIAISGSSIAKITFDLSSAMNVSNENTIELMTPDPNRQYGTGVFDLSEDPNSVIDRRRLSRVSADGYRRKVRSSADKPTKRRTLSSISSRISLSCGIASIAGSNSSIEASVCSHMADRSSSLSFRMMSSKRAPFQAERSGPSPQRTQVDEPELPLCCACHPWLALFVISPAGWRK